MLTARPAAPRNQDLSDARLAGIVATAVILALAGLIASAALPPDWRRPGSPLMQGAAILGSILLFASFLAVLAKKSGRSGKAGFQGHVWLASAGTALVVIHSTGSITRIPGLLLLALLALTALGVWSRLLGSRRMAQVFGRKQAGFAAPDESRRSRLAALITHKRALLPALDAGADEGTFSLTLRHWLARPRIAFAYHRAVLDENRLIGTRRSVPMGLAYWRPLHRLVAWGFLLGLVIHVVTTTVFAGYVAEGRDIYWWRLADWGS